MEDKGKCLMRFTLPEHSRQKNISVKNNVHFLVFLDKWTSLFMSSIGRKAASGFLAKSIKVCVFLITRLSPDMKAVNFFCLPNHCLSGGVNLIKSPLADCETVILKDSIF